MRSHHAIYATLLYKCFIFIFLQEYGIRGFPTIKVFAPGKPPVDYQGARELKPIAEFALQQVNIISFYLWKSISNFVSIYLLLHAFVK